MNPDSFETADYCGTALKSGFKTMQFRCLDSLVSCRRNGSIRVKKYEVSKISTILSLSTSEKFYHHPPLLRPLSH